MAFQLPDGKTARNIQEQVAFLTGKMKELIAFVNQAGLKSIQIVEELPEVGDPTVLYLLAKEDPEEGDYYDEYLWIDEAWELIGTTQIDLSDYCTLSTNQTITGTKTFKDRIILLDSNEGYSFSIVGDTNGNIYFYKNSSTVGILGGNFKANDILPLNNNTYTLGSSSLNWKDLYLSGTASLPVVKLNENVELSISVASNYALAVKGQIYPFADNTTDLGGTYRKFRDLYLGGNSASNGIHIGNGLFAYDSGFRFDAAVLPDINGSRSLGGPSSRWADLYLSGNLSDGTYSASVESLVKKARIYTHNITCSNGTLILIGSFSSSVNSQSSLGMAASSALKMTWDNNPVLTIVNGTTIHYFDTSDSTIKTATIGTFTSDSIMDY